ncbi:MAG: hypothetical protein IRZ16_10545 [Myxococcaceae bacterium]|nr:hypothetical protein [Myxococcaceae bacterium]
MFARLITMGLATWILVSAAAFGPPRGIFVLMLVVAFGTFASEVAAFYRDRYRFWTSALAVLLILSGFFLTRDLFLMWNNILCGLAIFGLSMVRAKVLRDGTWVPWSRNPASEENYEDIARRNRADVHP